MQKCGCADTVVLQEALLLHKNKFQDATHKLKVELVDISPISKIQFSVCFKITGNHLDPNGFNVWFDAVYSTAMQSFVDELASKVNDYISKLNEVISRLETISFGNVEWALCGDAEAFYCIVCYKDTNFNGRATYTVQFDQNTVLDVEYMTNLCKDCICKCLNL